MITTRKPQWLTIRIPESTERIMELRGILRRNNLSTICEDAHCPNIAECWNGGTATFMILGDTCTRGCRFCNVAKSAKPLPLNQEEPENLAKTVAELGLRYVVITSVDRDDLQDQGSSHFAECIRKVKEYDSGIIVEVLIPDFRDDIECLKKIMNAKPEVIAHNVETVRSLQSKVRDRRANYEQSLNVLANVKRLNPSILTKSSIMVGLGEKEEEVIQTMKDLRKVGVDFLTIGQYLQPSSKQINVFEYVPPVMFEFYKNRGEEIGFRHVVSGPFVRSSYRAGEIFIKNIIRNEAVLK